MRILLVFNHYAGNRKASSLLKEAIQSFADADIEIDIVSPESPGHGVDLVAKADLSNYDGLVAAGGDGTLYEVVNGLFKNPGKRIPIGILPIGTGNAFARDLNLHVDEWKNAIAVIAANKTKMVDVGTFETQDQQYYFLNIVGLGFVADVGETARKLKRFGNLSYTLGVLYQTLFLKPTAMKIHADGEMHQLDSLFVEVSNSRYTANFLMAPGAELDDGLLDITIAKPMSRRKLLRSFPKILTGDHIHMDEIMHFKAANIHITAERDKILTPDGELMGSTPVRIGIIKQGVEMFWN